MSQTFFAPDRALEGGKALTSEDSMTKSGAVSKWSVQDGSRWFKVVQDGSRWFNQVQGRIQGMRKLAQLHSTSEFITDTVTTLLRTPSAVSEDQDSKAKQS